MNTAINNVVNKNTGASKVAAKITAGKTLNTVVLDKVVPFLPKAMQDYADSAIGTIVVANAVSFAVNHFLKGNAKAEWAADAMMQAAMVEFMDNFDIAAIVDGFLASVPDVE